MKIPFFKSETELQKRDRMALELAKIEASAKAWNAFWFNVKVCIAAVFGGFALLILGVVYLARNSGFQPVAPAPQSGTVVTGVNSVPTANFASPTNQTAQATTDTRSSSPSKTTGKFQESEAEKAYERANGVEVVHRKDGTTYERKSRSRK